MSSEEKLVCLPIAQIRLDGGTQVREKVAKKTIDEYAERMNEGDSFPPVIVVFDGADYWLADGFHRLEATKKRQKAVIECRVFEGTLRDALLVAVKANSTHGLRRTNADKVRAVKIVLADEEWSLKSSRWIAEVCGVSRPFVEGVRRQLATVTSHLMEGDGQRIGVDGKRRTVRRATGSVAREQNVDPVAVALATADVFDRCLARLKLVLEDVDRLALGPGGKYLTGDELGEQIRRSICQLAAARPAARCRFCSGKGCDRCSQHGWLSTLAQAQLM